MMILSATPTQQTPVHHTLALPRRLAVSSKQGKEPMAAEGLSRWPSFRPTCMPPWLGQGDRAGLVPDGLATQSMTAQPSESVAAISSQSTYEIYRVCHSLNHDIYEEIRYDSRLTVDSAYNSFLDATHDIVPHWRNLLGIDRDRVETARWDCSINNGSGGLFGVQGIL